jgi:hypothetical protein
VTPTTAEAAPAASAPRRRLGCAAALVVVLVLTVLAARGCARAFDLDGAARERAAALVAEASALPGVAGAGDVRTGVADIGVAVGDASVTVTLDAGSDAGDVREVAAALRPWAVRTADPRAVRVHPVVEADGFAVMLPVRQADQEARIALLDALRADPDLAGAVVAPVQPGEDPLLDDGDARLVVRITAADPARVPAVLERWRPRVAAVAADATVVVTGPADERQVLVDRSWRLHHGIATPAWAEPVPGVADLVAWLAGEAAVTGYSVRVDRAEPELAVVVADRGAVAGVLAALADQPAASGFASVDVSAP